MNREQFEHTVRAAASALGEADVIVIGSQAIHASVPDLQLPWEATRSNETDVMAIDGSAESADRIELIGEASNFHQQFGIYAQGVDLTTARLPNGWRDRLVPLTCEYPVPDPRVGPHAVAWCLERHDLWASKIAAGRHKDLEYCTALVDHGLVDPATVLERVNAIPDVTPEIQQRAQRLIK
ncbi:MAG: hypothetical protein WD598_07725 [Acidimicrobiia bacterium]